MKKPLLIVALLFAPIATLAESYQVPQQPIFTKQLPFCVHRDVALKALATSRHKYSWSGLHEAHESQLTLFENKRQGTWFLVEIKVGSFLACVRARGNKSQLFFGEHL